MDYLTRIAAAESKLAIANFLGDKKMRGEAIQAIHKAKLEYRIMSKDSKSDGAIYASTKPNWTEEEWREFNRRSRERERELSKAASAGLFLTAADLHDE